MVTAPDDNRRDPTFEALVFGWTCATNTWNGETGGTAHVQDDRARLAGYYEQWLQQRPDPQVGDRVMYRAASGRWLHGEVTEAGPDIARVRWDPDAPFLTSKGGLFDADSFHLLAPEPHPGATR